MAPPKTMAISQQQQQSTAVRKDSRDPPQQQQQSSKLRKRRNNKQQANNSTPQQQVNSDQSGAIDLKENFDSKTSNIKETTTTTNKLVTKQQQQQQQQQAQVTLVPSERTTIKKQHNNQVPLEQQQQQLPIKQQELAVDIESTKKSATPITVDTIVGKHQQLTPEESDDIDAGIELDGSSNSGSSVKDMNEDPSKSTSSSPVMAQSNLVNENCNNTTTKHAIEMAPIEQLTGSLCTDVTPTSKKISTTKQQLAANQQVIDADEQLLQQKLQNKQRKSSLTKDAKSSANNSSNSLNVSNGLNNISSSSSSTVNNASGGAAAAPQSPALCKVCEQHVYQMERMMAEKSVYHKRCFRCHQCKIQLRVDNYSSHEGQVYCKAHHRQIFQPQVRLDNEDDVDIVAKSTSKTVDDYLTHRGRLSERSFSFLQPKLNPEGIKKRQMIICENEPAELPKDVVRSDTKIDDGIDRLNLNLNNILEKFERASASNGEESQSSSAGIVVDKPSFNIKKTLMAFETQNVNANEDETMANRSERPVVKKLTNLNQFMSRQSSSESEPSTPVKPLAVRRSESLMLRLKKYESRIAGEQVADDEASDNDDENNNDTGGKSDSASSAHVPKKLINLSSLKNQWETGDINKRRFEDGDENDRAKVTERKSVGKLSSNIINLNCNGNSSPSIETNEELQSIRQQLARKKSGSSSIKNIYENAIKEAQLQQASRRNSSDLLALNGFSTSEIQQQLLQQHNNNNNNNNSDVKTPTQTPSSPASNKDHFQLNLTKKANRLKERFEQGLINNDSIDDSDNDKNDNDEPPAMTKLEQIRQEKLEDLSIFTEGEIKAREARNMFQQIDRRLSAANGQSSPSSQQPKALSSVSVSMRNKLLNQSSQQQQQQQNGTSSNAAETNQPIRLTNNVRT